MNAITRLRAALLVACATALGTSPASAWWDDDDYYDRWYDGPWYGGYPGYGWGGYPGYWGGHPGYGWGGYPGHWGGHPGYGGARTIIVYPQSRDNPEPAQPAPQLPR